MRWLVQLITSAGVCLSLVAYAHHGHRSALALAIYCAWLNLRSYFPDDPPVRQP